MTGHDSRMRVYKIDNPVLYSALSLPPVNGEKASGEHSLRHTHTNVTLQDKTIGTFSLYTQPLNNLLGYCLPEMLFPIHLPMLIAVFSSFPAFIALAAPIANYYQRHQVHVGALDSDGHRIFWPSYVHGRPGDTIQFRL